MYKDLTIAEFKEQFEPCRAAKRWLCTQPDLATAWDKCTRPEWLMWAAREMRIMTKPAAVKIACACARSTLEFIPKGDRGALKAVKAAEKWLSLRSKEFRLKAGSASAEVDSPHPEAVGRARYARRSAYHAASIASAPEYTLRGTVPIYFFNVTAECVACVSTTLNARCGSTVWCRKDREQVANIIRSVIKNPFKNNRRKKKS